MLVGDAVEQLSELNSVAWPCLLTQQDWGYIPLAAHASLHTQRNEMGRLRECVGTLGAAAQAARHDLIAVGGARRPHSPAKRVGNPDLGPSTGT